MAGRTEFRGVAALFTTHILIIFAEYCQKTEHL